MHIAKVMIKVKKQHFARYCSVRSDNHCKSWSICQTNKNYENQLTHVKVVK